LRPVVDKGGREELEHQEQRNDDAKTDQHGAGDPPRGALRSRRRRLDRRFRGMTEVDDLIGA